MKGGRTVNIAPTFEATISFLLRDTARTEQEVLAVFDEKDHARVRQRLAKFVEDGSLVLKAGKYSLPK
jgi:hypothetical protein